MHKMQDAGTTLFLSSHILPDVEDLCDRVSIMDKGEIKKIFRLNETAELFGEKYQIITEDSKEEHEDYKSAAAALEKLQKDKKRIYSFKSVKPSLEEIFVQITKGSNA